ncbi:DNA translocase FtsK 4TM domain-containing protein [Pseudonocardia pini]|uniref:DNA translocase FtsK 4TM domain-containing protein n=1 Tax=Pseudonocardia pini TaxID=2758030 RepID=UPI0015F02508|nr:DNA translocase FtsK 4TM domain-containing protein [Pseudonocardia pini]
MAGRGAAGRAASGEAWATAGSGRPRASSSRTRSSSPSRSGSARSRTPAKRTPARRPPAKKQPDLIDKGIDAVGRGVVKMTKSAGRAAGRTREIDPAHRRDGLGVLFIVLAVISAAGIWWGAGGPVGRGFSAGVGAVFGLAGALLPVILLIVGVVLMTTPSHPEARPRIAVGTLLLTLGVLGMIHLFSGSPDDPASWATGGGAVGYVAATPLASGLTAWVAVPVLLLLSFYAFLVLTATPVREVPNRVRRLLGRPEVIPDGVGSGG